MRYWFLAFAIALVVVLAHAVGLLGLLIAILAFGAALFLLWADQLGFGGAWEAFGFDTPGFDPANWDRFAALLQDRAKFAKALTITLALTALWLILPEEPMLVGVVVAIGWSARRIIARGASLPAATAAQARASQPTGSPVPPPAGSHALLETLGPVSLDDAVIDAAQPIVAAILPAPAVSAEAHSAVSTATVSFMIRGSMSSASSLALLARGGYRKQRVRRGPKRPKRPSKSRTARKPTRHVPLHLKLPLGRRQIRRPKRPLQSGPKLPSSRARKPSS